MVPKMVARSARYQEDDVTLMDVNCNVSICEGLVPFWSGARLGKWAIIIPDPGITSHESPGPWDTGQTSHSLGSRAIHPAMVQSSVQSHQSLITPLFGAWGTKSGGNQCPAGTVHYPNRRIINIYDCLSPRMISLSNNPKLRKIQNYFFWPRCFSPASEVYLCAMPWSQVWPTDCPGFYPTQIWGSGR